jgi:hypothetical protein
VIWGYLMDNATTTKGVEDYLLDAVKADTSRVQPPGDDMFLVQLAWMGEQAAWDILELTYKKRLPTSRVKDAAYFCCPPCRKMYSVSG